MGAESFFSMNEKAYFAIHRQSNEQDAWFFRLLFSPKGKTKNFRSEACLTLLYHSQKIGSMTIRHIILST